jgi:hypothetical protein
MVEEPSPALPMDGNKGEASLLLVLSRASPHGRERERDMSSRHHRIYARQETTLEEKDRRRWLGF